MLENTMKEITDEAKYGQPYSDDEIQQYVEDRSTISGPRRSVHLWEFLLELLMDETYATMIQWTDEGNGEFKLKSSEDVARKWGQRKHKEGMNYDKLSRALRYYYSKNIIKKVSGRRFVYKFVPSSEMHAAVNAIKTHMLRSGRKIVSTGPFPHYQEKCLSQTPTENKQFMFYPTTTNTPSHSPRITYAPIPHPVVKTCHSPVRNGHRYEEESYEIDRKRFATHPYNFDLAAKNKLFEQRPIKTCSGMERLKRRHYSERDYHHEDRERDHYRLTPPDDRFHRHSTSDYLSTTLGDHETSKQRFDQYVSAFNKLRKEREKKEYFPHDDVFQRSDEASEKQSGFIDLASTRHVIHKDIKPDPDAYLKHRHSASPTIRTRHGSPPKCILPTDNYHTVVKNHYEQPPLPSRPDACYTSPADGSLPPNCYMYRRYFPMVDAETQTSTQTDVTTMVEDTLQSKEDKPRVREYGDVLSENKPVMYEHRNGHENRAEFYEHRGPHDSRPSLHEHKDAREHGTVIYENKAVERPPRAFSSSPTYSNTHLVNGSSELFQSVVRTSRVSTSSTIMQSLTSPSHCKCGCMSQPEVVPTAATNGTVVVYPKEVY